MRGTANMIFTVTSPSAVQGGFTVAFTLADVTTNATDHAAFPSGVLTFAGTAGETQTITVVVNGDTTIEANETLTVTLGTVDRAHGDAVRGHHHRCGGHRHDQQRR